MLDLLNSAASVLLMALLVPVAADMPSHTYAVKRIGFCALLFVLALQVAGPGIEGIPPANLLQTALTCLLLAFVFFARRPLMAMYLESIVDHPEKFQDTQPSEPDSAPQPMHTHQLSQARGRGIDQ